MQNLSKEYKVSQLQKFIEFMDCVRKNFRDPILISAHLVGGGIDCCLFRLSFGSCSERSQNIVRFPLEWKAGMLTAHCNKDSMSFQNRGQAQCPLKIWGSVNSGLLSCSATPRFSGVHEAQDAFSFPLYLGPWRTDTSTLRYGLLPVLWATVRGSHLLPASMKV